MSQFYETYGGQRQLSPLVRELSWSHNLLIMGKCKRDEEREFYLRLCLRERWGKRELERQIGGALFERTVLHPVRLSPAVAELHPQAADIFKDSYLVEFLVLRCTPRSQARCTGTVMCAPGPEGRNGEPEFGRGSCVAVGAPPQTPEFSRHSSGVR